MKINLNTIANFFIALVFVAILVLVGFVLIGYFTQKEIITARVNAKEIYTSTETECNTPTPAQIRGSCKTYTTTSYIIYTNDESFGASSVIYHRIREHQKYVFIAVGWKNFRFISEILEEPKQ